MRGAIDAIGLIAAVVINGWMFAVMIGQLNHGVTRCEDGEGPILMSILWMSVAAVVLSAAGFAAMMLMPDTGDAGPLIGFVGFGTGALMACVNVATFALNRDDVVIGRRHGGASH